MAEDKNKAAAPAAAAPKAKRTVLTPEQRIAKAEADLAALRDKAQAGDRKRKGVLTDKVTKLTAKRDELSSQIKGLQAELESIDQRLAPATEKPKG